MIDEIEIDEIAERDAFWSGERDRLGLGHDLSTDELVKAEIRAAEIVAMVGPDDAAAIGSWITDEEKAFLDEIERASTLGDGDGGSISQLIPEPESTWHFGEEVLGDGESKEPILDLSEDEMEGWRRWECGGEPGSIGEHAGWLAHQMIAHQRVRWRGDAHAPNPWWHALPWQSDDATPIDKMAFHMKFSALHSYFLAELCEAHFYKPITKSTKAIRFSWAFQGGFEETGVWVLEMDHSWEPSVPQDHRKFLVVVGAAVRGERYREDPFVKSRLVLKSRHVLLHDANEEALALVEAFKQPSERGFWNYWPDYPR